MKAKQVSGWISGMTGAAVAAGLLLTGQAGMAQNGDDREDRAMTCTAALMVAGSTRKANGQSWEEFAQSMARWKGVVEHHADFDIVALGQKMMADKTMDEIEATARTCSDEITADSASRCNRYADSISNKAMWYYKAAGNQAVLARGIGGNLGAAQDDIRLGCDILRKARKRMRETQCDPRLIESIDRMYDQYILDIPGPKGDVRLECPKAY